MKPGDANSSSPIPSALLHRNLNINPHIVSSASGSYVTMSTGQRILDATCGAAVSCLGHGNARVQAAMAAQLDQVAYCLTLMFGTAAAEELAHEVIAGTGGEMSRLYVVCSGSEAMDAAMKMARQYFLELPEPQPQRTRFIAREQSYHGTTLGPLGLGGHTMRRKPFEPLLSSNCSRVSACYAYRGMKEGESEEQYVVRLAEELDAEFQRVGPETVCAFVAEPVVGAALGCVPCVPGYFKAMKEVCDRYGALLVMDEIMCGMGRSGTLHAWQDPAVGVVPDIQTVGKGLGGGFAPVAGVLASKKVMSVFEKGTGAFVHGQTYQGHPLSCSAALAVQKEMKEKNLVSNVAELGVLFEKLLKEKVIK
ncbi:PLP-dependent transferase [Microthyrium microscopicum]|uniref:PLP-dependent transferase n=1 Tax=Microthyrium microscopicum TaxID=703497 RepID=A0A6A6UKB0_9PEZI|nr:PLP-dependent transferase [Microthyrium microscopicum]